MEVRASTGSCPLCEGEAHEIVEAVEYDAIWRGLESEWGATFSAEVRARHTPSAVTTLVECAGCGLHHFTPTAPGDAEFYDELSRSPLYYASEKWEFPYVAERITAGADLLDVGCGDGAFLRLMDGRVRSAVGLETNPEAVQRARASGLDVRLQDLHAFVGENPAAFDVVTSFHVLEHLPQVGPFTEAMMRCLRPGGMLILSVPYRDRILRPDDAIEPLDCPPHHVSRWSGEQLEALGNRVGAELTSLVYQRSDMHAVRSHVKELLGVRRGGLRGFLARAIARVLVSAPLYALYAHAGWLDSPRLCRHAVVAFYRRPLAT